MLLARLFEPQIAFLPEIATLLLFALPIFALQLWKERAGDMEVVLNRLGSAQRFAVCTFLYAFVLLFGATDVHEFIYFQF